MVFSVVVVVVLVVVWVVMVAAVLIVTVVVMLGRCLGIYAGKIWVLQALLCGLGSQVHLPSSRLLLEGILQARPKLQTAGVL